MSGPRAGVKKRAPPANELRRLVAAGGFNCDGSVFARH
jgi:hypothetical protein